MGLLDVALSAIGFEDVDRPKKNPVEKVLMSMRATSKCRYNASERLKGQSQFSFFTTTILSMGLIFIPLMQNTNIKLIFQSQVLNMMQIFLAVAVLVYSITISKAGYEVRAEKLNECGDKLKDLIRKLDRLNSSDPEKAAAELDKISERYSDIVADTENHERIDYLLATLDMKNDYPVRRLKRLLLLFQAFVMSKKTYILPTALMAFELLFITDMIGLTNVFPATLKNCLPSQLIQ